MNHPTITLRQWKESDIPRFTEMNSDPEVMRFFLKTLTEAESGDFFRRLRETIERKGWGMWAVDVEGTFAGFTGLAEPRFVSHFTPCVEIAWRFRREYWGHSIAYRAALEVESIAFHRLKLSELVSFTTEGNLRSRRLMERLEFSRDPRDDFPHPLVSPDHPLRPHVLYRKRAKVESR